MTAIWTPLHLPSLSSPHSRFPPLKHSHTVTQHHRSPISARIPPVCSLTLINPVPVISQSPRRIFGRYGQDGYHTRPLIRMNGIRPCETRKTKPQKRVEGGRHFFGKTFLLGSALRVALLIRIWLSVLAPPFSLLPAGVALNRLVITPEEQVHFHQSLISHRIHALAQPRIDASTPPPSQSLQTFIISQST